MAQDAFRRVRRYLSYNPAAAWSAGGASVGLGVLYVALIALLGLFADLVIEKGRIPPLPEPDEAALRSWLAESIVGDEIAADKLLEQRTAGVGLVALAWRCRYAAWQQHLREEGGLYYEAAWRVLAAPARWFPWTRSNHSYAFGLVSLAVGLVVLRGALTFVLHYAAASAVVEATSRLRRAVYHHAYRLGTLLLHSLGPSEAVAVFTRHLEAVHEGLYTWLTVTLREPTKFVLLLLFALILDPWLSLAFLFFAMIVWLVGSQLAAYFRRQEKRFVQDAAEQMTLLHESITIMRLVKAYLMELFNQTRVERQLSEYGRALMRRYRGRAIYQPTLLCLALLAVTILLYVAGWAVLQGSLSMAGTIALCTTLVSLYWPIVSWRRQRKTLQRARQSAGVLFVFLDRKSEVGQVVGAEFLPPLGKQLEFDHVTLREDGHANVILDDVSLEIKAGQKVALVSQEEREKHALIYLIPRFLDPTEGEIRIDGHRLRWVTLDSLRSQIALVLQNNLIFNDTVANNISCGDNGYALPQIIEAAKAAHAHQFIQRLPAGYKTLVGDMGNHLSISEQFRIALARAILRDPAIVIIEEPSAILDENAKAMIDDTFAHFLQGRTTIFLPHRIPTIRSCDRVFLFHKGRIQAAGEHRELLSKNELYQHLHYLEFNVFAEQS